MSKCLECQAEINQTPGRRPRKFCDNKGKCRLAHWNKNNPKEGKYVLKSKYDALLAQIKGNNKPENKEKILNERNAVNNASTKTTNPLTENECTSVDLERIKVLEYELKSPPKTAKIGVKTWIRVRENELKQLKEKIKN